MLKGQENHGPMGREKRSTEVSRVNRELLAECVLLRRIENLPRDANRRDSVERRSLLRPFGHRVFNAQLGRGLWLAACRAFSMRCVERVGG